MTTMISIDGTPVVIFGATRYYLTPSFYELLEPEERERIIAICDESLTNSTAELVGASEHRQARTD
jgi:hypothetical protein